MDLLKKLAGETAIYGVSSILGRVLNWVILTPYLTRVFVREEYGVISDIYFWAAILMVFFTYRLETAFFRFASREKRTDSPYPPGSTFSTASWSLLGTTLVLTSSLLLFAPRIADLLKYPDRVQYVVLFILIVALDALAALPFARLRLENRPIRFAVVRLLNIGINIVAIFTFLELIPWLIEQHGWTSLQAVYNPDDRISYVFWANLLASGLTLLLLLPQFRGLGRRPDRHLLRRLIAYALPLVVAALAGIINLLAGIPMLKYLGGGSISDNLALAGIYAAASKLAVLMNLFIQAYNYAAEPFFFNQAAASEDRTIYAQAARAFTLVGALAFVGIMLYLPLIQFFLGEDYRQGLGILPILLIAYLLLGLFTNFSVGYKLTDRTVAGGIIAVIGMLITIGLNYWLIPRPEVSYYAPAWAALACYGFMAVAAYLVSQRLMQIPYRLGQMLGYILLAVGTWAGAWWSGEYLQLSLWPLIALNTGWLLLFLALIGLMERHWLRRLVRRRA